MNKGKSLKIFSVRRVYVKVRKFCKSIVMERNNRKKYIHIDHETGSNEIFRMLGKTETRLRVTVKIFYKILTRNT